MNEIDLDGFDMEKIERQQAEVKTQIISHAAAADDWPTEVTLIIKNPTHLAEILETVWIKTVDYGELSQGGPIELTITAFGRDGINYSEPK